MKVLKKITILLLITLTLVGCSNGEEKKVVEGSKKTQNSKKDEQPIIVHKDANILKDRYEPPKGFKRVDVEKGSFESFLRNTKLKNYGEKVKYYDGRTKESKGIYDSVFDVDIGNRDLHQCADAIMLMRAEYLYQNKLYDEISFDFVDGFKAKYSKWAQGYRISVKDSGSSWYKATEYSTSYESFRKFMDIVFAYSGTLSLEKELEPVKVEDMKIGDVFIVGGSPGHASIIMDMAENEKTGKKVFMIAQSYMPAQQTQLLINRKNPNLSPWYSLDFEGDLTIPQWTFKRDQLKRF
ncbi:lipoprotein [Clostridioides difficile]|nr:lipoprotein [Clostridioides difficile]